MKAIKDFEGLYSVTLDGKIYSHLSNRFLKIYNHNHGYNMSTLSKDGKSIQKLVHRIVAEAYIPNPDNLPTVNHKDGNKKNNHVSNLEWMSYLENNIHALETGLNDPANRRKFTDLFAHKVCKLEMDGWRKKDIADSLGIEVRDVNTIRYSGFYSHITCEYDWAKCPTRNQKVSDEKAIKICELLEEGKPYQEIHVLTGASIRNIKNIKYRVTFKSLSESFNF